VKDSIGNQSVLFAELLGPCSDACLRGEIEMFGHNWARVPMPAYAGRSRCLGIRGVADRGWLASYSRTTRRIGCNCFNI